MEDDFFAKRAALRTPEGDRANLLDRIRGGFVPVEGTTRKIRGTKPHEVQVTRLVSAGGVDPEAAHVFEVRVDGVLRGFIGYVAAGYYGNRAKMKGWRAYRLSPPLMHLGTGQMIRPQVLRYGDSLLDLARRFPGWVSAGDFPTAEEVADRLEARDREKAAEAARAIQERADRARAQADAEAKAAADRDTIREALESIRERGVVGELALSNFEAHGLELALAAYQVSEPA
jgi:hypothetical protein